MGATVGGDLGNALILDARFGPMRPSVTGPELVLGTYAGVTANTDAGWVGVLLDLDVAHTAQLAGGAAWTSRIGTTLLSGVAEGGGGLAAGFNGGLGLLAVPRSGVGVRVDLSYRVVFSRGSTDLWTASLGLRWPGKDTAATRE
jgi:hypothetical protein